MDVLAVRIVCVSTTCIHPIRVLTPGPCLTFEFPTGTIMEHNFQIWWLLPPEFRSYCYTSLFGSMSDSLNKEPACAVKSPSQGLGTPHIILIPVEEHPSITFIPVEGHPTATLTSVEEHPTITLIPVEGHPTSTLTPVEGHPTTTLTPVEGHLTTTLIPVVGHPTTTLIPAESPLYGIFFSCMDWTDLKPDSCFHSYAVTWTWGNLLWDSDLPPSVPPISSKPSSSFLFLALYPLSLVNVTTIQATSGSPSLQVWKLMTADMGPPAHSN